MIQFNATREELKLIRMIVDRAVSLALPMESIEDSVMDIDAVHSNGCKLDLHKFLAFDNFNFSHDFSGIHNCLDRDDDSPTGGQLLNFFLPRCHTK